MAFKLGDLIIDRIQMGYAEKFDGTPLYVLSQLSDASIEISAESKDTTDKDGVLIKRFWRAKTGTFTATNAMLNLNILAAQSGNEAQIAGTSVNQSIIMPRIMIFQRAEQPSDGFDIPGYIAPTSSNGARSITVNALDTNGSMGKSYTLGTTASSTEFAVSGTKLSLPTDTTETQFIVKYDRSVTEGVKILNSADKFPKTVKLTLKALCVDPCHADELKGCYIVLPSFQPSPETTIALGGDDTSIDFTGDLQVNYCSTTKDLYTVYFCPDDDED